MLRGWERNGTIRWFFFYDFIELTKINFEFRYQRHQNNAESMSIIINSMYIYRIKNIATAEGKDSEA